jgi:hypothetical protein
MLAPLGAGRQAPRAVIQALRGALRTPAPRAAREASSACKDAAPIPDVGMPSGRPGTFPCGMSFFRRGSSHRHVLEGAAAAPFVPDHAPFAALGAGNSARLLSSSRGCRRTITTAPSWSNLRGALQGYVLFYFIPSFRATSQIGGWRVKPWALSNLRGYLIAISLEFKGVSQLRNGMHTLQFKQGGNRLPA